MRRFIFICLHFLASEVYAGPVGRCSKAIKALSRVNKEKNHRFLFYFFHHFFYCNRVKRVRKKNEGFLRPAEICDLLKGAVVLGCWVITWKVDTSMMYHLVKTQSVIKLYIFYNMLEVGDRLLSAFGQDTIDALLWTATEPRSKSNSSRSKQLGTLPHFFLALVYVCIL